MSVLLILAGSFLVNALLLQAMSQSESEVGDGTARAPVAGRSRTLPISVATTSVVGMSVALVAAATTEYALERWLVPQWEQSYLRAPLMVSFIVGFLLATNAVLDRIIAQRLGARSRGLPWNTLTWSLSNSALLGVAWSQLHIEPTLTSHVLAALAVAALFGVGTLICRPLSERLLSPYASRQVPTPFRGLPLAMTTAGLAVLALMALAGVR